MAFSEHFALLVDYTVSYPMPDNFEENDYPDPSRGPAMPTGCGIHAPHIMRLDELTEHTDVCYNDKQRVLRATSKEDSYTAQVSLDIAERSARNKSKPGRLPKKVHFGGANSQIDAHNITHSFQDIDLFCPKKNVRAEHVDIQWRELLQVQVYCNYAECICLASDLFESEEDHNMWVEENKYTCETDDCPCHSTRFFANEAEHKAAEEQYFCTRKRCACMHQPEPLPNKDFHDRLVDGVRYWCEDPLCDCEPDNVFLTQTEHNFYMVLETRPTVNLPRGPATNLPTIAEETEEMEITTYICPRGRCVCPYDRPFSTKLVHDEYVEANKFQCLDDTCPCGIDDVFATREDHDYHMPERPRAEDVRPDSVVEPNTGFVCTRMLCLCSAESPFPTKEDHDSHVNSNKYMCWEEECPCGADDIFVNEAEHDHVMTLRETKQVAPVEGMGMTPSDNGADDGVSATSPENRPLYYCGKDFCICGEYGYKSQGEHDSIVERRRYHYVDENCHCDPHSVYVDDLDHEYYLQWLETQAASSTSSGTVSPDTNSDEESGIEDPPEENTEVQKSDPISTVDDT